MGGRPTKSAMDLFKVAVGQVEDVAGETLLRAVQAVQVTHPCQNEVTVQPLAAPRNPLRHLPLPAKQYKEALRLAVESHCVDFKTGIEIEISGWNSRIPKFCSASYC